MRGLYDWHTIEAEDLTERLDFSSYTQNSRPPTREGGRRRSSGATNGNNEASRENITTTITRDGLRTDLLERDAPTTPPGCWNTGTQENRTPGRSLSRGGSQTELTASYPEWKVRTPKMASASTPMGGPMEEWLLSDMDNDNEEGWRSRENFPVDRCQMIEAASRHILRRDDSARHGVGGRRKTSSSSTCSLGTASTTAGSNESKDRSSRSTGGGAMGSETTTRPADQLCTSEDAAWDTSQTSQRSRANSACGSNTNMNNIQQSSTDGSGMFFDQFASENSEDYKSMKRPPSRKKNPSQSAVAGLGAFCSPILTNAFEKPKTKRPPYDSINYRRPPSRHKEPPKSLHLEGDSKEKPTQPAEDKWASNVTVASRRPSGDAGCRWAQARSADAARRRGSGSENRESSSFVPTTPTAPTPERTVKATPGNDVPKKSQTSDIPSPLYPPKKQMVTNSADTSSGIFPSSKKHTLQKSDSSSGKNPLKKQHTSQTLENTTTAPIPWQAATTTAWTRAGEEKEQMNLEVTGSNYLAVSGPGAGFSSRPMTHDGLFPNTQKMQVEDVEDMPCHPIERNLSHKQKCRLPFATKLEPDFLNLFAT